MLIIGWGNRDCGDDGAGVMVAERLRALGLNAQIHTGEAFDLLEAWSRDDDVVVVDAVVTGASGGKVWRWDCGLLAAHANFSTSTHGFNLGEAIGLARILDRLPKRLRVFGIEGVRFEVGSEISPAVICAVKEVAAQIMAEEVCAKKGLTE